MKKVDKDVEDKLEKKLLLNPTLEDIIKFLDGKIETIIRRTTDNMLVEDFTKTKENIGEKINWKKEKKKNVQHQLDSELFYLMSKGKRFILSCPELLVIMFNPETEQYEEAEYDPKYGNCNYDRGQPKPQPEKPINDKLF
ncbi:hypothetical protein HON01_08765, partial [Candidatus Woesearchaeota archaeon]|nr:hypothetical protein [Candidatus Woesearchaeota archaeon]